MAQRTCIQYDTKIANLTRELKHHIELKYELMDANNKLRVELKEVQASRKEIRDFYDELVDERDEIQEELDEVKQERDKLKRDKEIQKLGGLKLCYN
jgi:uncharacterized coiled-coil DUF342 family protein